jgi:hypothetical protein
MAVARVEVPQAEPILWALGCVLFSHFVTVFSVTYFDQLHVIWWGVFAAIASVAGSGLNPLPETEAAQLIIQKDEDGMESAGVVPVT